MQKIITNKQNRGCEVFHTLIKYYNALWKKLKKEKGL